MKTEKEYENLGRMLESLYEGGHANRRKIYRISFFKGVASGFGGVLGATVLIALLVWFLTLFRETPLIGPFVKRINQTVQKSDLSR